MASVTIHETSVSPDRRSLLKWTGALAGATGIGMATGHAQTPGQTEAPSVPQEIGALRKGMFSYMLASEQFPTPELLRLGAHASRAGFHVLSTSDHLQPWQANQGARRASLGDNGRAGGADAQLDGNNGHLPDHAL